MFLSTAMGINSVSLPFVLYQNQVPDSLIGFTTISDVFAGIFMIYFLHRISRKIGLFESMLLFGVLGSIIILIIPFYQSFLLWLALSFALGIAIISLNNLRRAWTNMIVKSKIRSMVAAITSTAICIGFTIGPIVVKFLGAGSYQNFIASSIFIFISFVILFPLRQDEPRPAAGRALKIIALIKRNKKMMLARFLTDFQCGTILFFTVIYGIKSGISPENSGLLISIFSSIGILDFTIGFLINHKSYQRLIFWGFTSFFIAMITLPFAIKDYSFAVVIYLILGWITSLVAICCWYGANLKQRKTQMIFINSAFMAIGLFGVFVGNFLTGIAMQIFGKEGFVIIIAAASLVYVGYILIPNFLPKNQQHADRKHNHNHHPSC